MFGKKERLKSVDDYISQFPGELQGILKTIRQVIQDSAPQVEERISYGMPGYFYQGMLVWFAVYKRHIGLYPKTSAMKEALPELSDYKGTKGSVHFPLDQPIPYDLIGRIVKVRVEENLKKHPETVNPPAGDGRQVA